MTEELDVGARRVAAINVPVLLSDTCFLLDVVRDPTRDTVRAHDRGAAAIIARELAKCLLVNFNADQVILELAEHRTETEDEAETNIRKYLDRVKKMDEILACYGGSGTSTVGHLHDHGARAKAILDDWLTNSLTAKPDDDAVNRAFRRVNLDRTPARKGNQSIKDCVVIETYLGLVGHLRNAGLTAPVVFGSSNTRDYCEGSGGRLKPDLTAEFSALQIDFAPNFGAARHMLGLPST